MRPILGGHVPPERVIGRDELIAKLWEGLENQSIVLVAERRIGKTSVLWKMFKEPPPGWHPIFLAIEGVRSPSEFIARIVDEVQPILSRRGRTLARLQGLIEQFGGQRLGTWELPEVKKSWKRLLTGTLEDIRDNFEERVVFLWDELPLMISNIKDDLGPKVAMELLDTLRDLRVTDDTGKLRMVFSGSIGLHLVVSELLHRGYRNDPTNDMVTLPLEGLEPEDARKLARQGLRGLIDEGDLKLQDDLGEVVGVIAESTDGLPYYINYTVDRLADVTGLVGLAHVPEAVDSLLLDPEDTAHFSHYAERVEAYYLFDELAEALAFAILKVLSHASEPMTEAEIWDGVGTEMELTNENLFQKTLALLVKDHYLTRTVSDSTRSYRFKYGIIQRWWVKNRG